MCRGEKFSAVPPDLPQCGHSSELSQALSHGNGAAGTPYSVQVLCSGARLRPAGAHRLTPTAGSLRIHSAAHNSVIAFRQYKKLECDTTTRGADCQYFSALKRKKLRELGESGFLFVKNLVYYTISPLPWGCGPEKKGTKAAEVRLSFRTEDTGRSAPQRGAINEKHIISLEVR